MATFPRSLSALTSGKESSDGSYSIAGSASQCPMIAEDGAVLMSVPPAPGMHPTSQSQVPALQVYSHIYSSGHYLHGPLPTKMKPFPNPPLDAAEPSALILSPSNHSPTSLTGDLFSHDPYSFQQMFRPLAKVEEEHLVESRKRSSMELTPPASDGGAANTPPAALIRDFPSSISGDSQTANPIQHPGNESPKTGPTPSKNDNPNKNTDESKSGTEQSGGKDTPGSGSNKGQEGGDPDDGSPSGDDDDDDDEGEGEGDKHPGEGESGTVDEKKKRKRRRRRGRIICLDYLKGICEQKRWKCKYAHPPLDMGLVPPLQPLAPMAGPSASSSDGLMPMPSPAMTGAFPTPPLPSSAPMEICEVWVLTGFCKFGDNCHKAHPQHIQKPRVEKDGVTPVKYKLKHKFNPHLVNPQTETQSCHCCPTAGFQSGAQHAHHGVFPSASPATDYDPITVVMYNILQQLSTERFEQLAEELFHVLSSSSGLLPRLIPLIFHQAVNNEAQASVCAALYRRLWWWVPGLQREELCNQVFNLVKSLDEIPLAEDQRRSLRRKRLANVVFLSHLLEEGFVSEAKVFDFATAMVNRLGDKDDHDEDSALSIEVACKLMSLTNHRLKSFAPSSLERLLNRLQYFALRDARKIQSMVMNVLSLCQTTDGNGAGGGEGAIMHGIDLDVVEGPPCSGSQHARHRAPHPSQDSRSNSSNEGDHRGAARHQYPHPQQHYQGVGSTPSPSPTPGFTQHGHNATTSSSVMNGLRLMSLRNTPATAAAGIMPSPFLTSPPHRHSNYYQQPHGVLPSPSASTTSSFAFPHQFPLSTPPTPTDSYQFPLPNAYTYSASAARSASSSIHNFNNSTPTMPGGGFAYSHNNNNPNQPRYGNPSATSNYGTWNHPQSSSSSMFPRTNFE